MVAPANNLYLIDVSEYKTVKSFLAQYLPYSVSILTWLTRVHATDPGYLDQFEIYSSQSNLSTTSANEPVVIIIKEMDRLRVFVSTEAQLNLENPVWAGEDPVGLEKGEFQFASGSAKTIYETSQIALEQAIRAIGYGPEGLFFHGISLLWCGLLYNMFNVGYNGPCERYVSPINQYLEQETLDKVNIGGEELTVDSANQVDAEQIRVSNKVVFPLSYVLECCQISAVLRKSDGDMVVWACTHADGAIAMLHVLPEWRRLGLAQILVNILCQKQARAFHDFHADYQLYTQAVVENFNDASKNVFKKLGWTKTDVGITWLRCVPE
ncbi:hypothetical protein BGW37DRAFT_480049 [Umbelopsis sp. PMI_123]|nr:hypothetical protein BGW37DRAFT_480049 [Umbelopsis sp. PMI_123]